MFTILVLGIMAAAIAPPNMGAWNAKPQHSRAAEGVREAFEYARAQAVATSLSHRVRIETENGGYGGVITIFQGASPACQFDFGAADVLVRTVEFVPPNLGTGFSDDSRNVTVHATASIKDVSPDEALNDDVCVRPDGTIRNARFNQPFAAPAGADALGSGTLSISVQDNVVTAAGAFIPRGASLRVIVPYSGVARVVF